MERAIWQSARVVAVFGIIGLSFLTGCTTPSSGLRATDEAARYLQNARGRYTIPGTRSDPWGPYIREASQRFDMPERWIRALMRQESGGNLYRGGSLITSSAGAMGLMQVMPGTYRELRARHNLGPDPFEPHDNIMAGVAYMREMYDVYGSPGFLAAYNAGPNRLDDYLANQRSLPNETRQYVAAIGPALQAASPRVRSPAEQYAINQLPIQIPPGPRYGYGTRQVAAVSAAPVAQTYRAQPMRPMLVAYTTPLPARQTPFAAPVEPSTRYARVPGHAMAQDMNRSTRYQATGGHLMSSALAAEVTSRQSRPARLARLSHDKPAAARGPSHPGWNQAAARPVHSAAACREAHSRRTVCGPPRQARK